MAVKTKNVSKTMIKDAMSKKLFGLAYSEAIKNNICIFCKKSIKSSEYDRNCGLCKRCISLSSRRR